MHGFFRRLAGETWSMARSQHQPYAVLRLRTRAQYRYDFDSLRENGMLARND